MMLKETPAIKPVMAGAVQRMQNLSRRAIATLAPALLLSACDSQVFVSDGVTDGSSFSIPPAAAQSQDPVTQSWVAYSLARSTCQVAMGGDNPARNHSFNCELRARRVLLQSWQQTKTKDPAKLGEDHYLDELQHVDDADFLYEYIWVNLRKRDWPIPARLHLKKFKHWKTQTLHGHKVETRLIGSWSYPPA